MPLLSSTLNREVLYFKVEEMLSFGFRSMQNHQNKLCMPAQAVVLKSDLAKYSSRSIYIYIYVVCFDDGIAGLSQRRQMMDGIMEHPNSA